MVFLDRSRLNRIGQVVALVAAVGLAGVLSLAAAHPAEAFTLFDNGQGQYGWSTPFSTPNDSSYFIKTQGRCAEGHSGRMYFRDSNQQVLFGPVQVPNEWHFADGYGFQLPAGLAPGDYDVYVDCGDWNQIIVNQWITGPGTLAQLLDYRDTAAPASSGPAVTVAPTPAPAPAPAPAPSSEDSGVYVSDGVASSKSRSARSPSADAASTVGPAPAAVAPTAADDPAPLLDATVTRESPTTTGAQSSRSLVAINARSNSGGGGLGIGAVAGAAVIVGLSVFGAVRRQRHATS